MQRNGRLTANVEPGSEESLPICPAPATRARLSALNSVGSGLVRQCDVLGLLHCHTLYHGGVHSLRAMVETAREIGLEYLGFTVARACGLASAPGEKNR